MITDTAKPLAVLALAVSLATPTAGCDGVMRVGVDGEPVTSAEDSPFVPPGSKTSASPDDVESGPADPAVATEPGLGHMSRLTHVEYENSLRAVLGHAPTIDVDLPRETSPEDFSNQAASQAVSPLLFGAYVEIAEHAGAQLAADAEGNLGCEPIDDSCVRGWVREFGASAYRRPLTEAEVEALMATYDEVAGEFGPPDGVQTVAQALLLSPHFIYRVEPGAPGDPLDSWAMASRLSYLFWDAPPDDTLLAAAANGELDTREGVAAEARRLLADDRARPPIARFFVEWLGVADVDIAAKDAETYPEWDEALAAASLRETRAFIEGTVFDGDGTYRSLLTSRSTWVDATGSGIYGAEVADDGELHRVERDDAHAGMLTLPAVMAMHGASTHSNPIGRGKFVRTKLLCQDLPEPPDDVTTEIEVSDEPGSAREQLAAHRTDPSCNSCHRLLEPVGFGFEAFDGIGRHRGDDVDTSGELVEAGSAGGDFEGAAELAAMLAESDVANACIVRQALEYALARSLEPGEQPTVDALVASFAASGGDVLELFVAITQTPQFRHR